ncbi:MAG: hypothetical protein JWM30_3033 [Burkholderia sp.]|nr:hypothetical protein [Burkholderia sp.]
MPKKKSFIQSIPFILTSSVLVATCMLILGLFLGSKIPGAVTLTQDSLSSWVSAIATAAIGVLTFILATETWRLRAAQTEQLAELKRENIRPNIGIHLTNSPAGIHFMNVKIANSGKGIAKKIRFKFLNRQNKPVTEESDPIVKVFHKLAMFRLGIESLGINQELSSFIFSFLDLEQELGSDIFSHFVNIKITFEDTEGNEYQNSFVVDFVQYKGISKLGEDSLNQIAKEIKSIREQLSKVIDNSSRRLSVNVFDAGTRAEEKREALQWIEEQKQARQEKL